MAPAKALWKFTRENYRRSESVQLLLTVLAKSAVLVGLV